MLIIQTALNFPIPSGSAQAVVSMPVMIPLGELAGVPWTKWARFMVPLQLLFPAAGFASLALAAASGRGPF
jgi:hypothetical protein